MKHIRYKILTRLGIWFSGIYANDGELIGYKIRMTLIRKILNRVWGFLIRHGLADDEEPTPHRDFPSYIPIEEVK